MTGGIQKTFDELLAERRAIQSKFEQRLWERWKPALDLYDWVLIQTQNVAVYFIKHHRAQAVEQKDWLYEAQTRLQARAYRTACEVQALLLSGNPEGALARWRTMHEILVVMLFLQKYGPETAERFLKYDLVQTAKNWDEYESLPDEWKILPVTPEEGVQARAEREKVLQKYGPAFKNENGWACAAFGRTKASSRVTLAELENKVDLKQFRFYYHIACNHIHVNMKGLANDYSADLVPSMRGFSAPAGTTLWGLAECTAIMLKLRPTPETKELEHMLNKVVAEASQAFLHIQQQMEQEEQHA